MLKAFFLNVIALKLLTRIAVHQKTVKTPNGKKKKKRYVTPKLHYVF